MKHISTDIFDRFALPQAHRIRHASTLIVVALSWLTAGCQTSGSMKSVYDPPAVNDGMSATNVSNSIILREGDVVKITFPSTGNLNTVQPIRRDGKITLQMVGEITAAGLTPTQLEAQVIKVYEPQLLTKEVTVSVESSLTDTVSFASAKPSVTGVTLIVSVDVSVLTPSVTV